MDRYTTEYPKSDIVLFEPAQDDPEMFFANVFSYAERRRLCEHAYQFTRRELLRRYSELSAILAPHGMGLDRGALLQEAMTLVDIEPAVTLSAGLGGTMAALEQTLTHLDALLARTAQDGTHDKNRLQAVPV